MNGCRRFSSGVRGTYPAHLNPENTVGTMQSIEHTLRALERVATQQQERADYLQKTLADYQAQANRPFEHEERLKELLVRQAQVNSLLDLDKGERHRLIPESRHDFMLRGRIAPHHHHLRSYRSPQINNPPGRRAAYRPKPGILVDIAITRIPQNRRFCKSYFLATGELAPIFGPSGRLLCNRNGENHHAIRPSSTAHR
jgi:hypothetical protein